MVDERRLRPSVRFGRVRSRWTGAAAVAVVLVASACVPLPPPSGPKVYLTFDDGPSVYTSQVLSELRARGVPATFFVVGQNAHQRPSSVQQEHADGHGIGDHTWDHADLTTLPPDQVRWELQSTADEIANLTGMSPTLWRPPYGAFNDTVTQIASSIGLSMRLWDVDPRDWSRPGTDVIVSNVVDNAHPDAIIILHDGGGDRSQTVAALPKIIDTLRARGYDFGRLTTTTGPAGPKVAISEE